LRNLHHVAKEMDVAELAQVWYATKSQKVGLRFTNP
jgi:hypothetical protein